MNYTVVHENGKYFPVRNIYCVGRNYSGHARKLGNPLLKEPIFFQKGLTSLTTQESVSLPRNNNIQHELELVLLIGKNGENIKQLNAEKYIAGIGLGLDLTDRNLQDELKENKLPWFLSKSFKNSAIVSSFSEPDFEIWSQKFWLNINGNRVQEGYSSDMQFLIPFLIEYLSNRLPLLEGDIIFTGTPEGVGVVRNGDNAELGLGNKVLKRVEFISG